MITTINGSVFDNLTEQSVIVHQCNVNGQMGFGIASKIRIKYPEVFKNYHEYCGWFKNGYENELLGTWARKQINENLIICSAITLTTYAKNKQRINYDAWIKILSKLEIQTRMQNEKYKTDWTLHIPDKINENSNIEEYNLLHELFYNYFNESPVKVIFHKY